jgi:uncharacterized membrane protein
MSTRWGLDPNVASTLAYALGPIGGVLFLLIEKSNPRVRFHALQSLVTFVAVAVLQVVLRNLPLFAWTAGVPFWIMTFALWVFLMVMALTRERYKVPVIGDFVERQLAPRAR